METNVVDIIKETVNIFDLFDSARPQITYKSRTVKHNISCPFHGSDTKPSFAVYPETNSAFCYTCDKSWDQISLWAQINEWWLDDGRLDMGKAINDLCYRYNIKSLRPDWKKAIDDNIKFNRSKRQGYGGVPIVERQGLKTNYIFKIARILKDIPKEQRKTCWEEVNSIWIGLDSIRLNEKNWLMDLKDWYSQATSILRSIDTGTPVG